MKEFAPETLQIGPDGTISLSEDQRNRWGLKPGSAVVIRQTPNGLLVFPEDPPLSRVYIEPTSACNLNCRTCMRHSWTEPTGSMTMATFNSLIEGLRRAPALHTVSFWGMGEPLLHPCIVDMISAVQLGADAELITNGLLLDEAKAQSLIEAGLKRLIVSVDGATSEIHAQNRAGADLDRVKSNLTVLRRLRYELGRTNPDIGIEFVLMRRNLGEVRKLRRQAFDIGASFITLTHVLPYTEDLKDEILYWMSADGPWPTAIPSGSPRFPCRGSMPARNTWTL